jgi:two-component system, chemotaxis family, protein-glutamate methylesterase/glutaminase
MAAIEARGGMTLVQEPSDAIFDGMPRAALRATQRPGTGTAAELSMQLTKLAGSLTDAPEHPLTPELIAETNIAEHPHVVDRRHLTHPAMLGCPECNGGMSIIELGSSVHYSCHVGHSFSPQTLLAAQREKVENSLWTAVAFLEEQAVIHQQMAARAEVSGADITHGNQLTAADDALNAAATIRRQLQRLQPAGLSRSEPV